jgi:hypothetical protein
MAKKANRSTYIIETPRTSVHLLFANLIGGGAGNLTLSTQEALNGEVISGTRTGAGKYDLVFRYSYPELKHAPGFTFVGTTDGLNGQCSAFDAVAGTASIEIYVGSTPTDLATTDTVYIAWAVRNSGANS